MAIAEKEKTGSKSGEIGFVCCLFHHNVKATRMEKGKSYTILPLKNL